MLESNILWTRVIANATFSTPSSRSMYYATKTAAVVKTDTVHFKFFDSKNNGHLRS